MGCVLVGDGDEPGSAGWSVEVGAGAVVVAGACPGVVGPGAVVALVSAIGGSHLQSRCQLRLMSIPNGEDGHTQTSGDSWGTLLFEAFPESESKACNISARVHVAPDTLRIPIVIIVNGITVHRRQASADRLIVERVWIMVQAIPPHSTKVVR